MGVAAVLSLGLATEAGAVCSGGIEAGVPCGSVPSGGCCKASSARYWCEGGVLCMEDCYFSDCGWTLLGGYSCGTLLGLNADDCPAIACTPDCTFDECGDDGCGGSCGSCGSGESCQYGTCIPGSGSDGCTTSSLAGCSGCACEACVCAGDSYCCDNAWDSTCVIACEDCGECGACTPDCLGKDCGSDGCGGECGTCLGGQTCQAGTCTGTACTPDCTGKQCGPDGCTGTCGNCLTGKTCTAGLCATDGCTPSCAGKECGDNGCGGVCGTCGAGTECQAGTCRAPQICTPVCAGRECGDDGCSGVCGACQPPLKCTVAGRCADPATCTPACTGKQCGDDGCDGVCGTCGTGLSCSAGRCRAGEPLPEDDAVTTTDVAGDGTTTVDTVPPGPRCPAGQSMVYGACVTVTTKDATGGGCSAGVSPGRWVPLLPLFLGALALIARRRIRGPRR